MRTVKKKSKKILCVPEKEDVLVQMGLSIVKVKKLVDSKVVVNDRKIQ